MDDIFLSWAAVRFLIHWRLRFNSKLAMGREPGTGVLAHNAAFPG
jgi:hypothetical protein